MFLASELNEKNSILKISEIADFRNKMIRLPLWLGVEGIYLQETRKNKKKFCNNKGIRTLRTNVALSFFYFPSIFCLRYFTDIVVVMFFLLTLCCATPLGVVIWSYGILRIISPLPFIFCFAHITATIYFAAIAVAFVVLLWSLHKKRVYV